MGKRTVKDQVIKGALLTAKVLLVWATAGMFWIGIYVIFSPGRVRPEALSARSLVVGSVLLVMSTAILLFTIDRWVKIIPGVMGYATLGGLIMLFSGHYGRILVPWRVALILTLFTIASAGLSLTFQERKLNVVDRVALMAFVSCLAIATTPSVSTMLTALSIGFAFLLFAWVLDRIRRRDGQTSSRRQLRGPAPDGAGRP